MSIEIIGTTIAKLRKEKGVTQEVYLFHPTPSFTAMLIFAREIINTPRVFSYFMDGRNKPYL